MKRFRVGDFYNNYMGEIIKDTNTYDKAVKIKNKRIKETNGKCDVWIYEFVNDTLRPVQR